MLEKTLADAKKFVQDHPREVAVGAVVFATSLAMYALGRHHGSLVIDLTLAAKDQPPISLGRIPVK